MLVEFVEVNEVMKKNNVVKDKERAQERVHRGRGGGNWP